jgi:hypothetical protein
VYGTCGGVVVTVVGNGGRCGGTEVIIACDAAIIIGAGDRGTGSGDGSGELAAKLCIDVEDSSAFKLNKLQSMYNPSS